MSILEKFFGAASGIVSRKNPDLLPYKGLGDFHEPVTQWTKLLWVKPKKSLFERTGRFPMTPNQTFAYYRQVFGDRYAKGGSVGYEAQELDDLAKALHEPSPDLSAAQLRQAVCQALPALCGVAQGLMDIIVPDEHVQLGWGGTKVRNTPDAEKLMGLLTRTVTNLVASKSALPGVEKTLSLPERSVVVLVEAVEKIIMRQTEKARYRLEFHGLLERELTAPPRGGVTTVYGAPTTPQRTDERRLHTWWPTTPPSSSPRPLAY